MPRSSHGAAPSSQDPLRSSGGHFARGHSSAPLRGKPARRPRARHGARDAPGASQAMNPASSRAAAPPAAVSLPVSDIGSHAGAVSGSHPREHQGRCHSALHQRRALRQNGASLLATSLLAGRGRCGSLRRVRRAAASTKAEVPERLGRGRPWLLLLVGDPPERQSAAGFSAGDDAAPHTAHRSIKGAVQLPSRANRDCWRRRQDAPSDNKRRAGA